ncbi:MAG: hypothetical protein AB8U25_02385 [Rickettsiales endosymbiont of Dermacentor nuttalli]
MGKLSHAVLGKNDPTTSISIRMVSIGNYINTEGLSLLNFAFDLIDSKIIGTRTLNDIQQEGIIRSYINFNRNPYICSFSDVAS